jgi:hypothetical protein
METGQPPVIAFHVPTDYTTPYECGTVFIRNPNGQLIPVIHVCGSYAVTYQAGLRGNNSTLKPFYYSSEIKISITDVANGRTGGIEGLMPIFGDAPCDFNPWDYWDCPSNPNCDKGFECNPNMTYEKADRYIDTIMAYVRPRLCQTLHLDPNIGPLCLIINTENFIHEEIEVQIFPNPSSGEIIIKTPADVVIRKLMLYDVAGKQIQMHADIDATEYLLSLNPLPP